MTIASRVDPLSWAIYIDHPMPAEPPDELWGKPSFYPVMQPVIHESVHFWHAISTTQGIELAFDCLKSMNALRFAGRQGTRLDAIPADWTWDGYRPFGKLRDFHTKGSRRAAHLAAPGDVDPGPDLSPFEIFEGLARYWDSTITSGWTTDKIVTGLLKQGTPTYSAAYRYTHDTIGPVAFILFPIFAYCALCTGNPVDALEITLHNYKVDGFPVPPGNFQDAWMHAFAAAATWDGLTPRPFAPMTTYKTEHKRYVGWKMRYAGVVPEDAPFTGHPILEDYIQAMMGLARFRWPDKSDYDREAMMFREFMIPGNAEFRRILVQGFQPPLIRFADGETWIRPTGRHKDAERFGASMRDFSALMGAAYGLAERAAGRPPANRCPCDACPIHGLGVCSFVDEFPVAHDGCRYRELFRREFGTP